MVDIPTFDGGYKPPYNWGATPCMAQLPVKNRIITLITKLMHRCKPNCNCGRPSGNGKHTTYKNGEMGMAYAVGH